MARRKRDYKAEYARRKQRAIEKHGISYYEYRKRRTQQRYGVSQTEYTRLRRAANARGISNSEFRKRAFILATSYGDLDVMKVVFDEDERAHDEWIAAGRRTGHADIEYYKIWRMYFDDDERWFFYH